MSNSVTVTVQLDGGAGTSQSFDLGSDAAAPAPPDATGDSSDHGEDAFGTDALPPAMDGAEGSDGASASAAEAPPPDFDGSDTSGEDDYDEDMADDGDSPPPPDA